jgi:hypothetical protein
MEVSHSEGDSSTDAPAADTDSTVEALQVLEHSSNRENQAALPTESTFSVEPFLITLYRYQN